MPRRRREMTDLSLAPSVGSKSYSHHNHHHHQQRSASSTKEKPQQRNAANARERARMRVLSRAFCRLKTTLPWVPADTKLSKLDTLRLATTYIGHLRSVLIEGSSSGSTSPVPSHPLSVSWPFMFNKSSSGFGGSGDPTGHSPVGSRSESPSSTSSSSSVASSDQFNFQDCRSGSAVSTSASDHLQLVVTHQHSAGQHHKNGDPRNLSRHPCHDDMELVSHHHHHHQHGQFSGIASDIPSHHQHQEQQQYHQTSATIAQHHGNLVVYVGGNNNSLTEIDYQHDQLMELS